jgi:uncharacterized membrane protein
MSFKKIKLFLFQPHVLFVIISVVFGSVFISITPPLWGLDEPSHFARVFHITKGDFIPTSDQNNPGSHAPDNYFELSNYRTADILDVLPAGKMVLGRADVTQGLIYDTLTNRQFSDSEHFFPFIAGYSPAAYPGAIIGNTIARVLDLNIGLTLQLTRIFSLLAYIAISATAIWVLRRQKIKWLFFLAALIPTAIFQASMITADGTLIAVSLLFFAVIMRFFFTKDTQINKRLLWLLTLTAIALPLIKVNHIFISAAIILIPFTALGSKRFAVFYKTGVLFIGLVLSFIWSSLTKVTDAPAFSQRADQLQIIPSEQINFVLNNPFEFIIAIGRSLVIHGDMYYQGLLFTVSGNQVQTPLIFTVILSICLLLVTIYAKDELVKAKKLIIGLCIGVVIVSTTVFASLYAGFTPVGWSFVDGIQGRYFLPLLLPVLMLISILLPVRLRIKERPLKFATISLAITCLIVSVTYVYLALY